MENSTAGSINKAYDLLNDYDLRINGETNLRVRHTLMTLPGQADKIKKVMSHPQALAQCEEFMNQRGLVAQAGQDTAGSAKILSETKEDGLGVIASELAADLYGLEKVQVGIEDFKNNYTRFFVIGKHQPVRDDSDLAKEYKTSLVFALLDKPGALLDALSEFKERKINLVKLESRPRRLEGTQGFNYTFYLDFAGHYQDPNC